MPLRTFVFGLVIAVVGAAPSAEAHYLGVLQEDREFVVNVDNGLIASGATAVTITHLIGRGNKIKVLAILTVPAGASVSHSTRVKNSSRVFVDAQPPRNTTANIEVVQGSSSFTWTATGDEEAVWDVVPAP